MPRKAVFASKQWLTVEDASRVIHMHQATVRELCGSGELPSTKQPGGRRMIPVESANAYNLGDISELDRIRQALGPLAPRLDPDRRKRGPRPTAATEPADAAS